MKVRIYLAWWLRWYLAGVILMARLTGLEPDLGTVQRHIRRAARVKVVG